MLLCCYLGAEHSPSHPHWNSFVRGQIEQRSTLHSQNPSVVLVCEIQDTSTPLCSHSVNSSNRKDTSKNNGENNNSVFIIVLTAEFRQEEEAAIPSLSLQTTQLLSSAVPQTGLYSMKNIHNVSTYCQHSVVFPLILLPDIGCLNCTDNVCFFFRLLCLK